MKVQLTQATLQTFRYFRVALAQSHGWVESTLSGDHIHARHFDEDFLHLCYVSAMSVGGIAVLSVDGISISLDGFSDDTATSTGSL